MYNSIAHSTSPSPVPVTLARLPVPCSCTPTGIGRACCRRSSNAAPPKTEARSFRSSAPRPLVCSSSARPLFFRSSSRCGFFPQRKAIFPRPLCLECRNACDPQNTRNTYRRGPFVSAAFRSVSLTSHPALPPPPPPPPPPFSTLRPPTKSHTPPHNPTYRVHAHSAKHRRSHGRAVRRVLVAAHHAVVAVRKHAADDAEDHEREDGDHDARPRVEGGHDLRMDGG